MIVCVLGCNVLNCAKKEIKWARFICFSINYICKTAPEFAIWGNFWVFFQRNYDEIEKYVTAWVRTIPSKSLGQLNCRTVILSWICRERKVKQNCLRLLLEIASSFKKKTRFFANFCWKFLFLHKIIFSKNSDPPHSHQFQADQKPIVPKKLQSLGQKYEKMFLSFSKSFKRIRII